MNIKILISRQANERARKDKYIDNNKVMSRTTGHRSAPTGASLRPDGMMF